MSFWLLDSPEERYFRYQRAAHALENRINKNDFNTAQERSEAYELMKSYQRKMKVLFLYSRG